MFDLCGKGERWAFVALVGLLAVHLGLILSILAFEGALKEIQTYFQIVGIFLIFAGLTLVINSAYLRNLQRKQTRLFNQNNTHKRNFRPSSYNSQVQNESEKKYKVTPNISRHSSKVAPWFSESSGPLAGKKSHRNIEEWLKEQNMKTPQDNISASGLISLV